MIGYVWGWPNTKSYGTFFDPGTLSQWGTIHFCTCTGAKLGCCGWKSCHYPLVNVYITMEGSTIFNGNIHYFYGTYIIFNSYVNVYQRVMGCCCYTHLYGCIYGCAHEDWNSSDIAGLGVPRFFFSTAGELDHLPIYHLWWTKISWWPNLFYLVLPYHPTRLRCPGSWYLEVVSLTMATPSPSANHGESSFHKPRSNVDMTSSRTLFLPLIMKHPPESMVW